MAPPFRRLTFDLPEEDRDLLLAELWSLGTLGLREADGEGGAGRRYLVLEAWFAEPLPPVLAGVLAAPRESRWPFAALLREGVPVEAADWMAAYWGRARPFRVGERFLVDPREPEDARLAERQPEAEGRLILLRIPARNAFGTGSHASTALVLEHLESLDLVGLRLLDVGTGSGILAVAALRLGARRVVGLDADPTALPRARENAILNGARPLLLAGRLAALGAPPTFDLALVNVLPSRWLGELPALLRLLHPRSRLIVSGLQEEDLARCCPLLEGAGLHRLLTRRLEGWAAPLWSYG